MTASQILLAIVLLFCNHRSTLSPVTRVEKNHNHKFFSADIENRCFVLFENVIWMGKMGIESSCAGSFLFKSLKCFENCRYLFFFQTQYVNLHELTVAFCRTAGLLACGFDDLLVLCNANVAWVNETKKKFDYHIIYTKIWVNKSHSQPLFKNGWDITLGTDSIIWCMLWKRFIFGIKNTLQNKLFNFCIFCVHQFEHIFILQLIAQHLITIPMDKCLCVAFI